MTNNAGLLELGCEICLYIWSTSTLNKANASAQNVYILGGFLRLSGFVTRKWKKRFGVDYGCMKKYMRQMYFGDNSNRCGFSFFIIKAKKKSLYYNTKHNLFWYVKVY